MTTALIAGGGLAGTVTAMALQRAGVEPVIHEAYHRESDGVGAFLTLAVNGLTALDELDLLGLVGDLGFATPSFVFSTGTGRDLGTMRNGVTLPGGLVSRTIRRADLYTALRDEAVRRGIRVEYGKQLDATEADDTGVTARFTDGSQARGDLLVGADGLRSRTREILDTRAPRARDVGLLNTGGFASGSGTGPLDDEPGVFRMVFGKRTFFAYAVAPDGDVWWFANPPGSVDDGAGSPDAWRARLLDLVRDDDSAATRIIEATPEILGPWRTYDFPTVPRWRADRMVIVGDAAHATSPASGQGASMAFEDAVVLGKCLRDVPHLPGALTTFERLRRDRVERVVATGKRNGNQKMPGPFGRAVRDLLLPIFLRRAAADVGTRDGWLYDHPLDWDRTVTGFEDHDGARRRP